MIKLKKRLKKIPNKYNKYNINKRHLKNKIKIIKLK